MSRSCFVPASPSHSSSHSNSVCRLFAPHYFSQTLLLIAPLLLLLNSAQCSRALPQNDWEEHRICGRLLINALKQVCNHQYAQPSRDQLYDNYYKATGVALRKRRDLSRMSRSASSPAAEDGAPRSRRGIIWECCTNKCSLNYIRTNYCAARDPNNETAGEIVVNGEETDAAAAAAETPSSSWQLVEEKRRR